MNSRYEAQRAVLIKTREDVSAFNFEWQALQACACPAVQPLLSKNSEERTLTLHYYADAKDMLSFSYQHIDRFLELVPQLIRVIHHCHQQGWVHGDIKPSNVLYLEKSQRIVLIDFAAALPLDCDRNALSQWEMTPTFATSTSRNGVGRVSAGDDWNAVNVWLRQLMQHTLTVRQHGKISRILQWLKTRLETHSD